MLDQPPLACIDEPSPKDYLYEQVLWAVQPTPKVNLGTLGSIYNQNELHKPNTAYACVCYGNTHGINILNLVEAIHHGVKVPEIDPATRWQSHLDAGAKINKGWSLQGWLNLALAQGLISGYAKCNLENVIDSNASAQPCLTGTSSIDWKATLKNNNIAVPGTCYGHCFLEVVNVPDKWMLKFKNSMWPKWWDNGYFYVKHEDFKVLFSCYSMFGVEHKGLMAQLSLEKDRGLAYQKGYWNGLGKDNLGTRYEGFVMASKLGKVQWSAQNPNTPIIRQDYWYMVSAALGRKIVLDGDQHGLMTRWEMAAVLVRV